MSLTTMISGRSSGVRDVVQRLPCHTAGEGSVPDDGDHMLVVRQDVPCLGQSVGPAERRGGVRVLDDVVLGLLAGGIAGETALAAQLGEVLPAGEQFMDIALMTGVPEYAVDR